MMDPNRARRDGERGATSTEYLFLLVFIAIAIIAGAQAVGDAVGGRYSEAANSVSTATN